MCLHPTHSSCVIARSKNGGTLNDTSSRYLQKMSRDSSGIFVFTDGTHLPSCPGTMFICIQSGVFLFTSTPMSSVSKKFKYTSCLAVHPPSCACDCVLRGMSRKGDLNNLHTSATSHSYCRPCRLQRAPLLIVWIISTRTYCVTVSTMNRTCILERRIYTPSDRKITISFYHSPLKSLF